MLQKILKPFQHLNLKEVLAIIVISLVFTNYLFFKNIENILYELHQFILLDIWIKSYLMIFAFILIVYIILKSYLITYKKLLINKILKIPVSLYYVLLFILTFLSILPVVELYKFEFYYPPKFIVDLGITDANKVIIKELYVDFLINYVEYSYCLKLRVESVKPNNVYFNLEIDLPEDISQLTRLQDIKGATCSKEKDEYKCQVYDNKARIKLCLPRCSILFIKEVGVDDIWNPENVLIERLEIEVETPYKKYNKLINHINESLIRNIFIKNFDSIFQQIYGNIKWWIEVLYIPLLIAILTTVPW